MAELIPPGSTLRVGKEAINAKIAAMEEVDALRQTQITEEQQARIAADGAHAAAQVAHTAEQIQFVEGQSVKQKVEAQQAQINNIIGGPASSAAEVIDGRMGADGTARATLGAMVREIHSKQLAQADQTATVKRGLNLLNTSQASPAEFKVQGRTLVNLLGNDGGCESLSPFTLSGTLPVLSNTQKRSGLNSIKSQPTASTTSYAYKDYSYPLDTTKPYLIGFWLFVESWTSGNPEISIRLKGTFTSKYTKFVDTSLVGKWQYVYIKIATSNPLEGNGFRLLFGSGGPGLHVAYYDEIALYEISSTEFSKIDIDPEYTGEKLAEKFPYVDSVQHLQGGAVRKIGKNMLPPFSEWTLNSNAIATEPYELRLNATAGNQYSNIYIPVTPNTTYSISVENPNNQTLKAMFYSDNTYLSSGTITQVGNIAKGTFTTPSNCNRILVETTNTLATVGLVYFKNPQLERGSTTTQFEPRNDDYVNFPMLASNVDRSIADSYDTATGKVFRRYRRGFNLDGSLAWLFATDQMGFKTVAITGWVASNGAVAAQLQQMVVKHDGAIIRVLSPSEVATLSEGLNIGSTTLYVNILDSYSGWTETINPNTNSIKALMNGWKANGNNGTVYNSWVSILTGAAPPTNTEAYCAANKAPGWTAWATLDYVLAQGFEEPFIGDTGAIALQAGGNQLELLEGVVIREKVIPAYGAAYGNYYINQLDGADSAILTGSQLKNRLSSFVSIYKNGFLDTKWLFNTAAAYGSLRGYIKAADYDPTAEYTVTYQVLDKHLYTSNAINAVAQYKSNPKMVQDQLVQDIADLETQSAVNVRAIAELYKKVKALGG